MTKEVMVTLSGLQLGDSGEDTVETVHIGEYYEKNGVHYLFFDELQRITDWEDTVNCWKGIRLRSEIC